MPALLIDPTSLNACKGSAPRNENDWAPLLAVLRHHFPDLRFVQAIEITVNSAKIFYAECEGKPFNKLGPSDYQEMPRPTLLRWLAYFGSRNIIRQKNQRLRVNPATFPRLLSGSPRFARALMRDASVTTRHPVRVSGRRVIYDVRKFLAQCKLLRVLPNERAALIARAQIRTSARDETIFRIGSSGDSMMVVLIGYVLSVISPGGKEIIFGVLGSGAILGEIALLDGKGRTADARAVCECRLGILNRCDVLTFFEQQPNALSGLVATLCECLRNADEPITEQAFMSIPVRLAKALLRITATEPQTGNRLSHVRLSQHENAILVGATRDSVNKCLGHWQYKGVLRVAENLITIVDRDALAV